jgi:DNA-binding CsgD family transcriptional regulator
MLQGGFMSVLQSQDRDQFQEEVVRFARQLGFDRVTTLTVTDRSLGESDVVAVDNNPPEYLQLSIDPVTSRRDPVLQHCKRQSVPLMWDRGTYVCGGVDELWEEQAPFGCQTGIALALHMPEGRHFALGVMRDQALPQDSGELTRLVADLQLFAVYAQDAALRILAPPPPQPDRPALTPRELEALRWTMEGKTAWEVGAILGISERTAVLHVNNAMHKLGCINKHQAVLRALKLGLIH